MLLVTPHQIPGVGSLILSLSVNLPSLMSQGKSYPWPRPPCCPRCEGRRLWGHGYVGRYFDGYEERLSHETLEMRGLRGGAHDEAGEPLAGVLGDDRADHEQPEREGRGPPVAGGGQPPAPAVLVARLPTSAPRERDLRPRWKTCRRRESWWPRIRCDFVVWSP